MKASNEQKSATCILGIADVDQHLSEQAGFCLIPWLLQTQRLTYASYEAWRNGQQSSLDTSIAFTGDDWQQLAADVDTQCRALNLEPEPQDFFCWQSGRQQEKLLASAISARNRLLTTLWQSSSDKPQLDLFADGTAVIAENRLRQAVANCQWDLGPARLADWVKSNPGHSLLGKFQALLDYGQHMVNNPNLDVAELDDEIEGLEQEVTPIALELMGSASSDLLAQAWRRLARAMQDLPFDPAQPKIDPTYALVKIPDWSGARDALLCHPQLYKQPALLLRLVRCFSALKSYPQATLYSALLVDLFPQQSERSIASLSSGPAANPLLDEFWDDFCEEIEQDPETQFSAYVLIREPGFAKVAEGLGEIVNPAARAVMRLIQCRQSGEGEIQARQNLQAIAPELLRIYLKLYG